MPPPRTRLTEHLLHDLFIQVFLQTAHLLLQLYLIEVRRVARPEGILGRRRKATTDEEEEEDEDSYQNLINQIEPRAESSRLSSTQGRGIPLTENGAHLLWSQ